MAFDFANLLSAACGGAPRRLGRLRRPWARCARLFWGGHQHRKIAAFGDSPAFLLLSWIFLVSVALTNIPEGELLTGFAIWARIWAQPGLPLAPRLFSFPFFSTAPSLFLALFSRENCVEIVKFLALSRV